MSGPGNVSTVELTRLLRHGVAPVVAWLVATDRMPVYLQGDITELVALLLALGVPMAFSWWRDQRRD